MSKKTKVWQFVEGVVEEAGLSLFDLDLPSGEKGSFRVFLSQKDGSPEGIQHEDCAQISKVLKDSEDFDLLMPGLFNIEVSSPGVNRRLRRPEHFNGAVGERIKLRFVESEPIRKQKTIFGVLVSFDGTSLGVQEEGDEVCKEVLLANVEQASVDFVFA